MKPQIIALAIFLLPLYSYAQLDIDVKYDSLDRGTLRCMYRHYYCIDTTSAPSKSSKFKEDYMILQIGEKGSRFFSYNNYKRDSIVAYLSSAEILSGQLPKIRGASYNIYKGYPSGNLIFTDEIIKDNYKYEEPIPSFDWTIEDETKDILGYHAQKASCEFRGRKYTAWFTPEIPVSEGPWKFSGLPGLILEVADTENHYRFEIVGVQKVKDEEISIADYKYIKTNLKKYYRTVRRTKVTPISTLLMSSGIKIVSASSADGTSMDIHAQRPLKYEFIEIL